jgi:hypothetical protein
MNVFNVRPISMQFFCAKCSSLSVNREMYLFYLLNGGKKGPKFWNKYSWLSLSRTRLTQISGWGKFLSRLQTSLCINIYNLTPVESNSDESKFRLSRIKVLIPRCRKPYYLHSLSRIYLSKHVYYLGITGETSGHWLWHFYLRLFHMFISQSVKLISDNIWIGLVLWHRLDVYNQKVSIHNKCAWVGIHQWLWKVLSIELFVEN